MDKLLLSSALLCAACSFSKDVKTAEHEDVEKTVDHVESAVIHDGSIEKVHVDPITRNDVLGAFGGMVFAADAVLEPDGGITSADGGLPHVVAVLHHDADTHQEQVGAVETAKSSWHEEERDAGTVTKTEDDKTKVLDADKSSKVLSSPLQWLGIGVLVAAALAALYRFRKAIPWLEWIP